MTDLTLFKFKMYENKELLKIFGNNFYSDKFKSSRNSFYCLLLLPTTLMIGFNLINPHSIFRRIAVFSSLGGSLISFCFNLKDDLHDEAKRDTVLGA